MVSHWPPTALVHMPRDGHIGTLVGMNLQELKALVSRREEGGGRRRGRRREGWGGEGGGGGGGGLNLGCRKGRWGWARAFLNSALARQAILGHDPPPT